MKNEAKKAILQIGFYERIGDEEDENSYYKFVYQTMEI